MQFPESWLREFCNPPISSAALADLLTMAGMEVEDARPAAPPFTRVVVAHVLSIERHPNADRLNVCQVDVGSGSPLQIVCGAPNVSVGIKVPCALVGAELPPADAASGAPFQITLNTLRGVESQGMLCSARELKLSEDHGGLLILDAAAAVGEDIRSHLRLDDTLLTLKLTPNLAHGLSVYGIAREVSALTGAPLLQPAFPAVAVAVTHAQTLPVSVEASDLCGRFSGRIVRGVNPRATTPAWMVERLARCGQRSVTALVDISNYVMFEFGRPSHIFDLAKIHGGLVVRWGRAGETLKLLNGTTITVDATVGVIADHEAVESLAGIMGGDATAVSDATQDVYVEAAFWWPAAVAGRSRRFNFTTDAGHRFERGVDPASTVEHLERITQLVLDICGGQAGAIDDQTLALPPRTPVVLRVARASRVIGMPVTQAECEGVMTRLGLAFDSEPGRLIVTPPSWRFDIQIEEDLIEEVIRVLGFHLLPDTAPTGTLTAHVRSETRRSDDALRHQLAMLGYHETINFSFVDERWERELAGNADPIRLVNPMSSQLAVMRSSLIGSLIGVLRFNQARKASRVRVFEVGRVFLRDASVTDASHSVAGVNQPLRVAGLLSGAADELQWGETERNVDFFDLKGDVQALLAPRVAQFVACEHPALHPGRCASVELDGVVIGFIGELHPRWRQAYELPSAPMLFELDAAALSRRDLASLVPVQRHQSVWRDLSVVASAEVTHDALIEVVRAANTTLIRSARLFDIYLPATPTGGMLAGERSLSLRLELLDDDVTLTDQRIDLVVAEVLAALNARLGVRLRA